MLVMRFVLGKVQDRRGDNAVVHLGLVCFAATTGLGTMCTVLPVVVPVAAISTTSSTAAASWPRRARRRPVRLHTRA